MTINASDVKLLKSQRLTDEDDGGGRATGTAVIDGEVNNLFPDISRLDRTLGRINLRKCFAGVLTDNGAGVTAGQFVSVADIDAGKLRFTPVTNANGAWSCPVTLLSDSTSAGSYSYTATGHRWARSGSAPLFR